MSDQSGPTGGQWAGQSPDPFAGWFRSEVSASLQPAGDDAAGYEETAIYAPVPARAHPRRGRWLLVLGAGAALAGLLVWTGIASPKVPLYGHSTGGAQAAPLRTFTLAASGDVLLHEGTRIEAARQAKLDGSGKRFNFFPLFEDVAPIVTGADLALCHAEVPMSAPGGPYTGFPLFSGPPEAAEGLAKAGYDSCSTASNHTLDKGQAGIRTTLDALDQAGIKHAGSARTPEEAATPLLLDANGVKVAQLSFTFGFNGLTLPASAPWSANLIEVERIVADAALARSAGAEVVVLSLHWGNEYKHEVTAEQRELAHRLLASPDIDLILGHHAHVVQPMEKIGEKWVVYGMGNLLAAKSHDFADGATREGILPKFTFIETANGRFAVSSLEVTPLYISTVPHLHVADVASALPTATGAEAARLRKASARTKRWVTEDSSATDVVVR